MIIATVQASAFLQHRHVAKTYLMCDLYLCNITVILTGLSLKNLKTGKSINLQTIHIYMDSL